MWHVLQLKGGSKPRALGWRFQRRLVREVGLWGVGLLRGWQRPSGGMENEDEG